MRYSRQREIMLKFLEGNLVHPTADMVYEGVKKIVPNISMGTVYRNLNQLAEMGLVKKIEGFDGAVHYDYNTQLHYHFLCKECNKIYDIDTKAMPKIDMSYFEDNGFEVEAYDIVLVGKCKHCKCKKIN